MTASRPNSLRSFDSDQSCASANGGFRRKSWRNRQLECPLDSSAISERDIARLRYFEHFAIGDNDFPRHGIRCPFPPCDHVLATVNETASHMLTCSAFANQFRCPGCSQVHRLGRQSEEAAVRRKTSFVEDGKRILGKVRRRFKKPKRMRQPEEPGQPVLLQSSESEFTLDSSSASDGQRRASSFASVHEHEHEHVQAGREPESTTAHRVLGEVEDAHRQKLDDASIRTTTESTYLPAIISTSEGDSAWPEFPVEPLYAVYEEAGEAPLVNPNHHTHTLSTVGDIRSLFESSLETEEPARYDTTAAAMFPSPEQAHAGQHPLFLSTTDMDHQVAPLTFPRVEATSAEGWPWEMNSPTPASQNFSYPNKIEADWLGGSHPLMLSDTTQATEGPTGVKHDISHLMDHEFGMPHTDDAANATQVAHLGTVNSDHRDSAHLSDLAVRALPHFTSSQPTTSPATDGQPAYPALPRPPNSRQVSSNSCKTLVGSTMSSQWPAFDSATLTPLKNPPSGCDNDNDSDTKCQEPDGEPKAEFDPESTTCSPSNAKAAAPPDPIWDTEGHCNCPVEDCPYSSRIMGTTELHRKSKFRRHWKEKHVEGKPSVHCPLCGKAFSRRDNMRKHYQAQSCGGLRRKDMAAASAVETMAPSFKRPRPRSAATVEDEAGGKEKEEEKEQKKKPRRRSRSPPIMGGLHLFPRLLGTF